MITILLVVAHESSGPWVVVYLESAKFVRVIIPHPAPGWHLKILFARCCSC